MGTCPSDVTKKCLWMRSCIKVLVMFVDLLAHSLMYYLISIRAYNATDRRPTDYHYYLQQNYGFLMGNIWDNPTKAEGQHFSSHTRGFFSWLVENNIRFTQEDVRNNILAFWTLQHTLKRTGASTLKYTGNPHTQTITYSLTLITHWNISLELSKPCNTELIVYQQAPKRGSADI